MPTCTTTSAHCSQCGSTSTEDADVFRNGGYSECCNEPVSASNHGCRANHARTDFDFDPR